MNSAFTGLRPVEDKTEVALDTILNFMGNKAFEDLNEFLCWDFTTRLYGNPLDEFANINRAHYLTRFIQITNPSAIHPDMIPSATTPKAAKIVAHVLFIAVILDELKALKVAFNIPLEKAEDYTENGMRFWKTKIKSKTQLAPLDVVVTMVGSARNVECAAALSTVFNHHSVGLCVLVGMAAGLKGKTKFCDVVVAYDMVIDYEGQRVEPSGSKKRPKPYVLNGLIKRDLDFFSPSENDWHAEYARLLPQLYGPTTTNFLECKNCSPSFIKGVVLSGECLLADGSLPDLQNEYSEKVRAAEQEGSGFARMCEENQVPWLIFRGISDYGEPEKADTFQKAATLAASLSAIAFVETHYRMKLNLRSEVF